GLAVGDAGVQAQCVERMTKLVAEGRTLLFVSHNLSVVEAVCQRGVFLLDGHAEADGSVRDVLGAYIAWVEEGQRERKGALKSLVGHRLAVERVVVQSVDGEERYRFESGEPIEIQLHVLAREFTPGVWFSVGISDGRAGALILCSMLDGDVGIDLSPGRHLVTCRLASLPLSPRT